MPGPSWNCEQTIVMRRDVLEQLCQVRDKVGLLPWAEVTNLEVLDPAVSSLFVDVLLDDTNCLFDGRSLESGLGRRLRLHWHGRLWRHGLVPHDGGPTCVKRQYGLHREM